MRVMHKLMMMYAAMGMMMPDVYGTNEDIRRELSPIELEEVEKLRKVKELERKKKQGLKEWNIQGITVIALNYKNALRKASRIKELLS